jgi:hypothetical protein
MEVFKRSCFDCHSDSTVYPWYSEIQPLGWWLNSHIEDGKRHLDFDRFASYRPVRQYGKFKDIVDQLQQDEMPLGSYIFIHRYARLTTDEKEEVIHWSGAMMDSMRTHFPIDSPADKRSLLSVGERVVFRGIESRPRGLYRRDSRTRRYVLGGMTFPISST